MQEGQKIDTIKMNYKKSIKGKGPTLSKVNTIHKSLNQSCVSVCVCAFMN